jgi:hypothetical protein
LDDDDMEDHSKGLRDEGRSLINGKDGQLGGVMRFNGNKMGRATATTSASVATASGWKGGGRY